MVAVAAYKAIVAPQMANKGLAQKELRRGDADEEGASQRAVSIEG